MLWYGPRGPAPTEMPATVEERSLTPEETARLKVKFTLFSKKTTQSPDGTTTTEVDFFHVEVENRRLIHIITPLPRDLEGRHIDADITKLNDFQAVLREICCGRPKPFPPSWPPIIINRPDLTMVVVPYQNPKLQEATRPEDLVDQNLAMVYLRKKPFPFPGGTTTDCGGLPGVWCPPPMDPFYTLRLARDESGWVVQLTHLNDSSRVIDRLPAQVRWDPNGSPDLSIEDRLSSIEEKNITIQIPSATVDVIFALIR